MLKNKSFNSNRDAKIESLKRASLTFLLIAGLLLILLYFLIRFENVLAAVLVFAIALVSFYLSFRYAPGKKPGRKLVAAGITTIAFIPWTRNTILIPLLEKCQVKFQEVFPGYIDYYIGFTDLLQTNSSNYYEFLAVSVLQVIIGFGFIHYGVKAMLGKSDTYNIYTDDFKKDVQLERQDAQD